MLTFKWIIGLFCLLFSSRVEGVWQQAFFPMKNKAPENTVGESFHRCRVQADQLTCGTNQALIKGHVT